jgi:hypothetical protein
MKRFGWISTTILFLALGIAASVAAQQDEQKPSAQPAAHEDQAAPPQENREPDAKPDRQQDEKRTQENQKSDRKQDQDQEKRDQKEQKDDKQAREQEKPQQKDDTRAQQEDKNHPQMKPGQDEHRAGGNAGSRIPDDKFRAHFGHDHHFRMSRPTVVSGQPRFQYGGYWFVIADPWPVGWDYADDCYIDEVNGEYLLFDLAHPGVSIVVNVVF